MNDKKDIREIIKEGTLLFDGAMGTYFSVKEHTPGSGCERACIDKPLLVSAIHREYLEAGCSAIKTNTFAANRISYNGDSDYTKRVIRAAFGIAQKAAAPYDAFVFADIGPINGLSPEATRDEYDFIADTFLELGADKFIFETNSDAEGLADTARHIREKCPEAFIIASFAVMPEGYTRDGLFGADLIAEIAESGLFDAAGLNCICGARQLRAIIDEMGETDVPLSVMPNAGYPTVIDNRTFYDSDPVYFGEELARIAMSGAAIVGGCCGTTPRHIAEAAGTLAKKGAVSAVPKKRVSRAPAERESDSAFWRKLKAGEKVLAVELDPPDTAELGRFMEGARDLQEAGVDILTIADCPVARARMDSSILSCKVMRELGMEALPHLTCRDRNLNATKALLLGLNAEGVQNVLVVTGDPIPSSDRDEVKSVYQFNSRKMASFITSLGRNSLAVPFNIFGALNLNARNFDIQLGLAKQKVERGMSGFLTQPVLTKKALDNLKRAKEELAGAFILGGIMPIVSERNARYMESEINGINVAPEIIERYAGLGRDEGEELAVELSGRIAESMHDHVDGFYIMTPFNRTGLVRRIIRAIRQIG